MASVTASSKTDRIALVPHDLDALDIALDSVLDSLVVLDPDGAHDGIEECEFELRYAQSLIDRIRTTLADR